MKSKQLTKGQVLLWSIIFILVMGLVGKIDRDSQQAILEEQVNIRDRVSASIQDDERIWTAYYIERARCKR